MQGKSNLNDYYDYLFLLLSKVERKSKKVITRLVRIKDKTVRNTRCVHFVCERFFLTNQD